MLKIARSVDIGQDKMRGIWALQIKVYGSRKNYGIQDDIMTVLDIVQVHLSSVFFVTIFDKICSGKTIENDQI